MNDDRYRPISWRLRLKIIAATLVTVVVLWLALIYRPGGHYDWYLPKPCKSGQAQGCVGGQANVMLIPAADAASTTTKP